MEHAKRRLAAVVSADVVGYTRLMGVDETGTLARLNACIDAVISRRVDTRDGNIIKYMGDGLLIGASRPKVNTALSLLEGNGAIKRSGKTIVCSVMELEDIAGI